MRYGGSARRWGSGRGCVVKERLATAMALLVLPTRSTACTSNCSGVRVLLEMDAQRAARQLRVGRPLTCTAATPDCASAV